MMKYDIESQSATPDLLNKKNQHYLILLELKNIVEHLHPDQELSINDQQILELVALIVKVLNHNLDQILSSPSMNQGFYGHLHNQIENRKSTKFIQKCLKFLKSDRLKAPIWVLLELNGNTFLEFIQQNEVQQRYQNYACIRQGELLDILDSYYSKHIKLIGDKIYDPPTPQVKEQSQIAKCFFPLPPNISNNMQGDIFERFNQFEDIQPIKHVTSLDCDDDNTHAPTHKKQEMETPEIRFGSDNESDYVLDDEIEPEQKPSELQYLSFQCKKSTKLLRDLREKQVEEYWNTQIPQNNFTGFCQSCNIPIKKRKFLLFQGSAQYCNFSGNYYCNNCMSNELIEIPQLILNNFNFTKMRVSKEAYEEIENKKYMKKCQINYFDNIVYENQMLYNFLIIKRSLRLMYDLLCQDFSFKSIFVKEYLHLLLPINIFSLYDLIEIKNGNLIKIINEAYQFGIQHIQDCPLCQKLQVKCGVCQQGIIYIFDIINTQYCRKCKKLFHRQCFYDKCINCGQDQKFDQKRLQKQ